MPMRRALDLLPTRTRKELDRRLLLNGFAGYAAISSWLTAQGHPVGKTSVGAYAKSNRVRILCARLSSGPGIVEAQLRAQCLVAAASQGQAGPADLIERADHLLAWVIGGRSAVPD